MSINAIFEIGFLMGLLGSVHCIGMCGPLVLALPMAQKSNLQKWGVLFLYHFGKISSYSVLGLLLLLLLLLLCCGGGCFRCCGGCFLKQITGCQARINRQNLLLLLLLW